MSSGDDDLGKPPRSLHVVHDEQGKPHIAATPTEEQVRKLFMQSKHITWSPFAKSMGWRTEDRKKYPDFEDWATEKREIIARNQSEEIAEALFSHRPRWHADVLSTIKEYPEVADTMMLIIKRRMNDVVKMINDDEKERVQHVQSKSKKKFVSSFNSQCDNAELVKISTAIRIVIDAKHKALMIDKWNVADAEKFTDPVQFEAPHLEDQTWSVVGLDGQKVSIDQVRDLVKPYYDEPTQSMPKKANGTDLETT